MLWKSYTGFGPSTYTPRLRLKTSGVLNYEADITANSDFTGNLDALTPRRYTGATNRYTASGNGTLTTIVIPHGLTGITTTSTVIVTPNSSAAAGYQYVTTDATNINIVYTVAPVTGTNNLIYSIQIK